MVRKVHPDWDGVTADQFGEVPVGGPGAWREYGTGLRQEGPVPEAQMMTDRPCELRALAASA